MLSLNVVAVFGMLLAVCGAACTEPSKDEANDRYCCTPPVFEGKLGCTVVVNGSTMFVSGSFHFDLQNKRVASIQTAYSKGAIHVNVIEADEAMYVIMPDKQTCKKLPPLRISNCLRKDLHFMMPLRMGGMGSYLDMDVFGIPANETSILGTSVCIMKENCLPISNSIVTKTVGIQKQNTLIDIKAGIVDPSVFDVPGYCNKGEEAPMTDFVEAGLSWHMIRREPFL